MSKTISKETITRLIKDVKQIIKSPLTEQGIYYVHDDTDMLKGYAMIIGPEDTPYFGGFYFFQLTYPYDYPHSPPEVKYCTNENNIRFNPNLYACGKVCISLLNTWRGEQWTSCQTISTVLLTLCTLLCDNPLLNEPGVAKGHHDCENYNEIVTYANFYTAICSIIRKKESVYMSFFDHFYEFVKENFNKNYVKIYSKAEKIGAEKYKIPKTLVTKYYFLNVNIDYSIILSSLQECKHLIENV